MDFVQEIKARLQKAFVPFFIEVVNESSQHHGGDVNAQTHFKAVVVSDKFQSMTIKERHEQAQAVIGAEVYSKVHALSLHLRTCAEWQQQSTHPFQSPACRGGRSADQNTQND